MTAIYDALSVDEKREVRMYGVTVAGMREAVESSILLSCRVLVW